MSGRRWRWSAPAVPFNRYACSSLSGVKTVIAFAPTVASRVHSDADTSLDRRSRRTHHRRCCASAAASRFRRTRNLRDTMASRRAQCSADIQRQRGWWSVLKYECRHGRLPQRHPPQWERSGVLPATMEQTSDEGPHMFRTVSRRSVRLPRRRMLAACISIATVLLFQAWTLAGSQRTILRGIVSGPHAVSAAGRRVRRSPCGRRPCPRRVAMRQACVVRSTSQLCSRHSLGWRASPRLWHGAHPR